MVNYQEKLLVLLVEKYRSSKKDAGTGRIARRTQLEPEKLYKNYRKNDGDLEHIEAVNQAAEACRRKGFLTFEMNGFSSEISKIYLVDEKIDEIEQFLGEHYQYESKHAKRQYVEKVIEKYSGAAPAAEAECERLRQTLEKNKIPGDYGQIEDILKALSFIENNWKLLYLREASILIYGSSKYLEEKTLDAVCRLLRNFYQQPCSEDEMQDEILERFHIVKEQHKLRMKGNVKLMIGGERVDLSVWKDGIDFSADDLQRIEKVEVHTPRFMTVENLTSYLRLQESQTTFFYLGGYMTRSQRDFLKKIYSDNSEIRYLHFGDIDAGGFYIFEQLRQKTGIPFEMYRMSVDTLRDGRFRRCLQPLTENDRVRLKSLAEKDMFREVAGYMLEENAKLEQEIVSYTE